MALLQCGTYSPTNARHSRSCPPGIRTVVLDFSGVPAIDITAGTILRGLVRTLKDRGIAVDIAELRDEVVEQLKIIGAEYDLGPLMAHRTIEDCLAGRQD